MLEYYLEVANIILPYSYLMAVGKGEVVPVLNLRAG
jgi:hypothetical protein